MLLSSYSARESAAFSPWLQAFVVLFSFSLVSLSSVLLLTSFERNAIGRRFQQLVALFYTQTLSTVVFATIVFTV